MLVLFLQAIFMEIFDSQHLSIKQNKLTMKFLTLPLTALLLFLFINPTLSQTCTSSGGDYDPDLDLEPYRFRCGTAMMHGMKKVSKDYKIIKGCSNYYSDGNYYRNKGKIYYSKEYGVFDPIAIADEKSFRCEDGTVRDNDNIYFRGEVVENIDKSSFKSVGYAYCADKEDVYYRNRYSKSEGLMKIAGADATSFKLIGDSNSYYAKDNQSAYFNGKVVQSSDPSSFKVLEYGYAHDKNHAYYNGITIEGMNGANFKVLKNCFLGSDGVNLSNGENILQNSDAKSFRAIECGYYKDNNNVYLNGMILEGVDSETFQILSWGYTKDKGAVYCDTKVITDAKPETFEVLGRKHSKDGKHIFFMQQTIDCDYDSFVVDTKIDYMSQDKNHSYKKGIQINL